MIHSNPQIIILLPNNIIQKQYNELISIQQKTKTKKINLLRCGFEINPLRITLLNNSFVAIVIEIILPLHCESFYKLIMCEFVNYKIYN